MADTEQAGVGHRPLVLTFQQRDIGKDSYICTQRSKLLMLLVPLAIIGLGDRKTQVLDAYPHANSCKLMAIKV